MRFNKNAHCFAVEPSGWRFTFDASIFVTLFRRFAPSDSPRVHQKTTATAVVFVYGGGGVRAFKQKRTLLRSRTLPAVRNVPKAHIAPQAHRFCQRQKHRFIAFIWCPSGRLPRVVCFALDQSIVASDKCLSYAFILLSPKSTKVSFGDPFFARNDIFLSATCQRQKHRIIAFACKILLFFRQGKTVRNTDGFLLFGFIVFC